MNSFYWSNRDKKQFKKLLNISNSIQELYIKLFHLELENKKDTDEYIKTINYLKMAIEIEQKRYEEICSNNYQKDKFINYISINYLNEDFLVNIDSIIVKDYNNKVFRRMLNNLTDRFMYETTDIEEDLLKDLISKCNNEQIALKQSNIINVSVENDILRGYLFYLKKEQEKSEYKSLKRLFIENKYFLAFINQTIENDMINNNFEIRDNLYLESLLIADLFNVDQKIIKSLHEIYSFNIVNYNIYTTLTYQDIDYNNSLVIISAIIMQSLIRSGLISSNDELKDKIKSEYEEFIVSSKYTTKHLNDKISIHLIDSVLDNSKQEQDKVYRVTFRKK